MSRKTVCWYPMYASFGREMKVKGALDELGIESFIPMRYRLAVQGSERQRELVPALHNLIFVHSYMDKISELKMTNRHCVAMQYMLRKTMIDGRSGDYMTEIMTVPDKQMHDFMQVASAIDDENVVMLEYTDFLEKEGRHVRIIGGTFAGVEGVIKRIKKNKIVVVPLNGIAAVAITHLSPSYLQFL